MDYKLMRDFEELEGLSDQVEDDADSAVDDDDDDPSFRPTLATNLNNADIYYEVKFGIALCVLHAYLIKCGFMILYPMVIVVFADGKTWHKNNRISRY